MYHIVNVGNIVFVGGIYDSYGTRISDKVNVDKVEPSFGGSRIEDVLYIYKAYLFKNDIIYDDESKTIKIKKGDSVLPKEYKMTDHELKLFGFPTSKTDTQNDRGQSGLKKLEFIDESGDDENVGELLKNVRSVIKTEASNLKKILLNHPRLRDIYLQLLRRF